MSDLEKLFLVIAAIYLAECLVWVRRASVVFVSLMGHRCRLVHATTLPGNDNGGLLPGNPLPPLGTIYVCQPWPISISPEGIYSYTSQTVNPAKRPVQPTRFVRFEEIRSIAASSKELFVNGDTFVKVGSTHFARYLADLLRQLSALSTDQRGKAIEAALNESVDIDRIAERIDTHRCQVATLRISCNALFLYVVFASLLLWIRGPAYWLPLLLGMLVGLIVIAVEYFLAHRVLYPRASRERLSHLAAMLLAPPVAIRSGDSLSRDLLIGFHPLAVAHLVCPPQKFLEFAQYILRDASCPMLPVCPAKDRDPRETERWFRSRLHGVLNDLVRRVGTNPEELTAPPRPTGSHCRSYCPRCEIQYVIPQGECHACGGVPLQEFEQDDVAV